MRVVCDVDCIGGREDGKKDWNRLTAIPILLLNDLLDLMGDHPSRGSSSCLVLISQSRPRSYDPQDSSAPACTALFVARCSTLAFASATMTPLMHRASFLTLAGKKHGARVASSWRMRVRK